MGHGNRFDSNKMTEIHFDNRLDYKVDKGIPGLRWIDDVQQDLKHAGINNWIKKVMGRLENLY